MVTYIDDNVACSPMITGADIKKIAEEFDLVISLTDVGELRYNPEELSELGVEYVNEPVEEFSAPNILRLFKLAYRIYNKALSGGRVLIHCSGGYSRSCTLATAYLVLKDLSAGDALKKIAERAKDALAISAAQLRALKLLEKLVSLLGVDGIASIIQFAERFRYGWGEEHSSLVTEYSLELSSYLKKPLGLDTLTEQVLAASSIVHDVGAVYDPKEHHIKSYELVSNSLDIYSALGHETREAVAWAAYHHRRKAWNPLINSKVPLWCRPIVARASAILQVADALATITSARIREVEVIMDAEGSSLALHLKWGEGAASEVADLAERIIKEKAMLLAFMLGINEKEIVIVHDVFTNTIITSP
ncbi:MAG: dual specificity protein phosphatase family protein [Desulfurococcales archaeon]|nr:dual specificity protein phosphatase family protein [Desulfurococcales archaeon]